MAQGLGVSEVLGSGALNTLGPRLSGTECLPGAHDSVEFFRRAFTRGTICRGFTRSFGVLGG